jgi:hypothetical protein
VHFPFSATVTSCFVGCIKMTPPSPPSPETNILLHQQINAAWDLIVLEIMNG